MPEKRPWFELTAGQKAKRSYDWFVEAYRFYMDGEEYDCHGGQDMGVLTRLMASGARNATEEEVQRRLALYIQDGELFLSKNGHALKHFKWNAYSPKEMQTRETNQRRVGPYNRPDATREDIERVTRSITDARRLDDETSIH